MARRSAPACAVVAVAVLSLGAYPGDARVIGHGAGPRLTLALARRTATLTPGFSVRVAVTVRRRNLAGPVMLSVASKLPRGLTARLAPAKTRGKHSVLTLKASTRLRPGRYVLKVRATDGHRRSTAKLVLTVARSTGKGGLPSGVSGNGAGTADMGLDFSITGSPGQSLDPGESEPIDLQIENPNSAALTLNSLAVTLSGIRAPRATATLPCTASDFSVQQYSGLLPLVITADTTVTLQQLGVPQSEWPEVSMLDAASDQDGCQGASLSLSYGAGASLG
jgi:hypothetical protein